MAFRGGQELPFQITWLEPGAGFTNETPVPGAGVVVRVRHEPAATAAGGTEITYRVEVDGPDEVAAEAGTAVSADFPEVIAALAAMAEQRRAGGRR